MSPDVTVTSPEGFSPEEQARRWRLVLGGGEADGVGLSLSSEDRSVDRLLEALYEGTLKRGSGGGGRSGGRGGSLEASAPTVVRWLEEVRNTFPRAVVRVMQQDAIDRLDLKRLLLEPEMMEAVEPDVHLVGTLLSLAKVMPARSRETARQVVAKVVSELERRLSNPMRQAVTGALQRSVRNRRPRHAEIDWHRTIRANLRHYQKDYKTVVPEVKIGYGRRRSSLADVILCVDQSGSMASSVVYAGVFGAVLASLRAVKTQMVVFDTSVVDLTEHLEDPVELLFGTQLGGGTDIHRALSYCQGLVRRPSDTIIVLISDLYEGGDRQRLLERAASLVASGVWCIALLALNDEGAPSYDHDLAAKFAALGIPVFACTPDLFPDLMATALEKRDVSLWASAEGLVTVAAQQT